MNTSHLPQSKYFDTNKLGAIFNHTTNSYKFFWFGEIIKRAVQGVEVDSIRSIIEDMIVSAYYMVNECKLKLGFNDKLEETAEYIYKKYKINSNMSHNKLKTEFYNNNVYNDLFVTFKIDSLKKYVPFCLLSPFVDFTNEQKQFSQKNINMLNEIYELHRKSNNGNLIYRFGIYNRIDTEIIIDEDFIDYVEINYGILNDFAKYNLVAYLQKKNPSVPGIIYKLEPALTRDLNDIRQFYKDVVKFSDIADIYTGKYVKTIIDEEELSIDHFIPWSFVAHDEIWNLTPTSKSINSSKGNNLPNWDKYFDKLIDQKMVIHKAIWKNEKVHNSFNDNKIQDKYINVDDIKSIYNNPNISKDNFRNCMYNYMKPIYDVAERSGFQSGWYI